MHGKNREAGARCERRGLEERGQSPRTRASFAPVDDDGYLSRPGGRIDLPAEVASGLAVAEGATLVPARMARTLLHSYFFKFDAVSHSSVFIPSLFPVTPRELACSSRIPTLPTPASPRPTPVHALPRDACRGAPCCAACRTQRLQRSFNSLQTASAAGAARRLAR